MDIVVLDVFADKALSVLQVGRALIGGMRFLSVFTLHPRTSAKRKKTQRRNPTTSPLFSSENIPTPGERLGQFGVIRFQYDVGYNRKTKTWPW